MFFYVGVISIASALGFLATGCRKVELQMRFFYILSGIVMFIPLAMRTVGVDYVSYVATYEETEMLGWNMFWKQYTGRPEPLYAVLNFVACKIFHSFQGVNFLCALVTIVFTYAGIYRYREKINLGITIWSVGFLYYILMFGLNRMMIAVALYTWAYQYYLTKNLKKYSIWCIIAGMFHYSALLMIPLYFVLIWLEDGKNKYTLLKKMFSVIGVVIVFVFVYHAAPILFGGFSWFVRYEGYFNLLFDFRALNNNLMVYLLVILMIIYKKQVSSYLGQFKDLINLFNLGIMLALVSVVLPIHRLCYFMFPVAALLYGCMPGAERCGRNIILKRSDNIFLETYILLLFLMGCFSIYKMTVVDSLWAPYITPYAWGLF